MKADRVFACSLALVAALAFPTLARSAEGGDPPQTPGSRGSGIVVEEIHNSFVVAPDVRFTTVDDRGATLLGAYAGVLLDRTVLLGGAGYWMPDKIHSLRFGYAGGIVEWRVRPADPVTIAVRGLVGGGAVTTADDVWILREERCWGDDSRWGDWDGRCGGHIDWSRYTGFLIAEPQVSLLFHVTPRVGINVGAGYRFIGEADGYEDRLRGAYGSIAVQIGGR